MSRLKDSVAPVAATALAPPALKIAIIVQGRFHAFDLAREMISRGSEVTLLTNYPKYIVKKFGIPPERVINCVPHGILSRLSQLAGRRCNVLFERFFDIWFSRWAARVLVSKDINAIHAFSGVSEDVMLRLSNGRIVKGLVRGSSHIRTQARLLKEESKRSKQLMDQPTAWKIAREEREYRIADAIFVLSSFAKKSFEDEGVPAEKLHLVPLGTELKRFRATQDTIERRCERITNREPLRVLTVGSFTARKGALDLIEIAQALSGRMRFRMVGDVPSSVLKRSAVANIEFVPRQPQFSLPSFYAEADVFVFPTIEDGYAAVLSQAQAAGLPILATPNCAASDILVDDRNGWILPVRNPGAFIERLTWCDANREALSRTVRCTYENHSPRDWTQVAAEVIDLYQQLLLKRELN